MTADFFAEQTAALRRIHAKDAAVDPDAFLGEDIVVTARPELPSWPFTAMIVGFGTSLVICVEARYLDWVREHATGPQTRVVYLATPLAQEGARRGEQLNPMPPNIGWALSRMPDVPSLPAPYRLARVPKAWMDEWQPKDRFTNALGFAVQAHRRFRNQFAHVVFDERGAPAAVAGTYDTSGLSEIGVDVAPEHRRRGLSQIVVSAAAREIVEGGGIPFYQCEIRNIRSQHTALASGFLPACSRSFVIPAGVGLDDD